MSASYNGKKAFLKYLFTATFADGHVIKQTQEDASELVPPIPDENGILQGKNRMYDVTEYEKTSPLVTFTLQEAGLMGIVANKVELDLTTGDFTINGLRIGIAEQLFMTKEPLKIIYFKEGQIQTVISQKTGETIEERHFINRFFLGWQTTVNGKNVQETICVGGQ